MNSFIETLNQWGVNFLGFAWPMLWQSSLLIAALLVFNFLFRRKLRASIRYALWLVVLVKLCVPTTLALPTSPAWWLHQSPPPVAAKPKLPHYTVTYDQGPLMEMPSMPLAVYTPPKPEMTKAAWLLVISVSTGAALLLWMLVRWWQITQLVRRAATSGWLTALADEVRRSVGMKNGVPVKLTAKTMSPAVCGLFRPVILIPQSLAENFSDEQLRAVLLHELIHLRRGDVWLNFLQTLLQITYWWHPLVWLANARIRRVREEAVDDAVMLALRDEAETYAPTLLEVAKLALNRPLATLGLVGILESRSALRQRIERLVDFQPPRKAGLTLVSLLGILAFTAVAVPMGEGPSPTEKQSLPAPPVSVPAAALQVTNGYPTNIAGNYVTGTVTGILTDPNFRMVMHALEQRSGSEKLAEPEVTTTSGRGRNRIAINSISMPVSKLEASQLAQDGKLLYEMGKLDDADGKLKAALALDSENASAKYYLELVQSARSSLKWGVTKPERQNLVKKLDRIRFPLVSFDHLSLGKVVHQLSEASRENDPEKLGVRISTVTNSVSGDSADINSVVINIAALSDVRLADVLDAVLLVANEPIKYSILDDGVVFSARNTADDVKLYARTFKVDPNVFYSGLQHTEGTKSGLGKIANSSDTVLVAARKFFLSLGVDLNLPPGKSVYYNETRGTLFVKATESDLDLIERAIQALNEVAPQIHIKARFLEVPKGMMSGMSTLLIKTNFSGGGLTGILSNTNAQATLRALQSRKDVEFLAEPEVTSTSGRQTQMRATQVITVITNFVFQENITNGSSSIVPQMSTVQTGPILDVVPYVLSDGNVINLTAIPSLTEFLGYQTPPTNAVAHVNDAGDQLPVILPEFRVRQAVATLNLWDGQTMIVGGMPIKQFIKGKEVGGNFKRVDKELLVFITATIVDPAGNRVHPDDSNGGIPPQPAPQK